jgi:hypothetical protein
MFSEGWDLMDNCKSLTEIHQSCVGDLKPDWKMKRDLEAVVHIALQTPKHSASSD